MVTELVNVAENRMALFTQVIIPRCDPRDSAQSTIKQEDPGHRCPTHASRNFRQSACENWNDPSLVTRAAQRYQPALLTHVIIPPRLARAARAGRLSHSVPTPPIPLPLLPPLPAATLSDGRTC